MEEYLSEFDKINFSIITYYEILNGLLYKDAKKQLGKFNDFISINAIIPLTIDSVKISALVQATLRKKGVQIGHTDVLIAGIAIENNLQLVTNNIDHFKRIKDLEISNWLK
jgi:tRNA(fMet)-specific endonuclease VapC